MVQATWPYKKYSQGFKPTKVSASVVVFSPVAERSIVVRPKVFSSPLQWPTIRRSYSLKVHCSFLTLASLTYFLSFCHFLGKIKLEIWNLLRWWKICRVNRPVHRIQNLGHNEGRQGARRHSSGLRCICKHGPWRRHWIVCSLSYTRRKTLIRLPRFYFILTLFFYL